MIRITKEQFEDILFSPEIPVSEVRSFKRSSIKGKKKGIVKLVSDGVVLAVHEVTPEGNFYFMVGE